MRPRTVLAAATAAALTAGSPGAAGEVTGTALYLQRIAAPPQARLVATLLDVSRADAPAVELGRAEIAPAGQPPYAFAIAYDPAALDPRNRYVVRAELRDGERLLFTTDTAYPVLTGDHGDHVEIVMVMVGG